MYNTFFGFREKPFRLVPNPAFLFLSRSHEIALAHLSYALEHGEGFAVITGEVGTGKTTLCRKFLEGLDDTVESAYIFNPKLEFSQLLGTICNEFGIETQETGTKELLDLLNDYLIQKNTEHRKVVLLIDEAQGLSTENLELVRMLSNLETTRSKLLQIVLMGQPELEEKLESPELRQLAQRISLSYRLAPLSAKDTQAYIQHRLWIAAQRQIDLFSADAFRLVYRFSRGIPRLINIACDRALLIAYSQNRSKVNSRVMQSAIMEILSSWKNISPYRRWIWLAGGGICILALVFMAAFLFIRSDSNISRNTTISGLQDFAARPPGARSAQTFKIPDGGNAGAEVAATPAQIQPSPVVSESIETVEIPKGPAAHATRQASEAASPSYPGASGPAELPVSDNLPASVPDTDTSAKSRSTNIGECIVRLDHDASRKQAVNSLLSIWQQPRPNADLIPAEAGDDVFFDIAARQYGLRCFTIQDSNWALVRQLNLPAIIALKHDRSHQLVYLTLVGWQSRTLYLDDGKNSGGFETDFDTIRPYLEGSVYVYWNNALGFDMIISYGADSRAVIILKNLLRKVGYDQVSKSPNFDLSTQAAVLDFQARHKLAVDGLVGTLTKIKLLQEARTISVPVLLGTPGSRS